MNPKTLNIIALVIAGIVVVQEIPWLGRSNLAIIFLGLAVAIGLNSVAQLLRKD